MLLIIIGIILVALFYYFIVKTYSYWKVRGVPQEKPLRILREMLESIFQTQSFPELVNNLYNQCPSSRYYGVYQAFFPTLLIKDPDLLKQLTVKEFDHFTDHMNFIPDNVDPLWSKNLFILRGQKWREMRTILSPSFTSSKMKAMFVLMVECAENFVQHFLNKNEDVITVELRDAFTRFTNDVIATAAFGIKVDSLGEPNNKFYLMGKEATNFSGFWKNLKFFLIFIFPKLSEIIDSSFFSKEVSTFFRSLIDDTLKTREEKGIVRPDMINLLMETRRGIQKHEENGVVDTGYATAQESESTRGKISTELTNEDITAQALIFFVAGFDSVSSLMCFTSYELTVNPDIQERLRKEVFATLEECGGKLTYEGLLKMKYMDMVVSESLRKWPNLAAADRVCTKPFTIEPVTPEEKPVHLKIGDVIWLPTWAMHRDAQYFPNPERFDPERFSDENKENIKSYTYFPFGLGPRNCIGSRFALLETKAVLFYILLNFQLIPVEKTQIPLKLDRKSFNRVTEIWVGLKRLKNV